MRTRLALRVRRGLGLRPGEHRFPGHADVSGIELEGHRTYAPGDDLRHLDWNVLGRLDLLLVRRFTAEREVPFHFLLDTSASMAVPAGDGKLAAACALVEALGTIALDAGDAVRVALLGGAGGVRVSPVLRARGRLRWLRAFLGDVGAAGGLDLGAALAAYASRTPDPGATFVVSDFLGDPAGIERGVAALRARRNDVTLLQVLGPTDVEPAKTFQVGLLADAESGETHPMRLTAAVRARYAALLAAHVVSLRALAVRTGADWAQLVAGGSLDAFVRGELVRLGVVRRR